MGRNGAGKSTLLRAAAGLARVGARQDRGAGGVALLPQRPGDFFVHERVGEELRGGRERRRCGASASRARWSRSRAISPEASASGSRWRSRWPAATAARRAPAALLLDEPTRGMDRARKGDLAVCSAELPAPVPRVLDRHPRRRVRRHLRLPGGPARARRGGRRRHPPRSCSPAAGTSRAEVARILTGRRSTARSAPGARGRPARAGWRPGPRGAGPMSWEAAAMLVLGVDAARRLRLVRALPPAGQIVALVAALAALASPGASPSRRSPTSSRPPTSRCSPVSPSAADPASR